MVARIVDIVKGRSSQYMYIYEQTIELNDRLQSSRAASASREVDFPHLPLPHAVFEMSRHAVGQSFVLQGELDASAPQSSARAPSRIRHSSMTSTASSRAGARLVAFLTTPRARPAQCLNRASALQNTTTRSLSSTSLRWQQSAPSTTPSASPSRPSQTPLPTQATQQPTSKPQQPPQNATAEKVHHELSPSDESEPLRSLDETPVAFDPSSPDQIDWTRSFQGLSSTPFTPEQAAILQQEIPFDDIEIKPDGIIYLPEIKYRRILNRAFGPGGWGLAPRGETIVTGKLVTREYGLVAGGR